MDIQEYILSGVIEAYVTGIANERETREVEHLSQTYPEIAAAIDDCRQTMEAYAGVHAVSPPPALKHTIWQAIQQETDKKTVPELPHILNKQAVPGIEAKPQQQPVSLMPWKYGMAAAILLLAGSLAGNVLLVQDRNAVQDQVTALQQQQRELTAANNLAAAQQQAQAEALHILMDTTMKKVQLNGVGAHTDNKAMVYWDSHSGSVFLSLTNMPAAPEGKQYQLWAIVDGQPVDAGMYSEGVTALHRMKTIAKAEMFAITLEQQGGSPSPTMEQMMVAGKPG